jgi:anti-sigma factor RsiW
VTRHVEELLLPYLRGEVDPPERREVEAHLDGCAECRAARDDFAAIAEGLRDALPAPPVVHWGAYRALLRERLDRRARSGPGPWSLRPWPAALAAGLVAVLVYVSGPWLGQLRTADVDLAVAENLRLASRLELIRRFEVVQRLELLEDLDVIAGLERPERRPEG